MKGELLDNNKKKNMNIRLEDEREKNIFIRDENVSGVGDDPVDCTDWLFFLFLSEF